MAESLGTTEPAAKTQRMEAEASSSGSQGKKRQSALQGVFEEILQEQMEEDGPSATSSTSSQVQIHAYLSQKPVDSSESPYIYWERNKLLFPTLAATAAKFLCAPSTSVDSERLFSAASNIMDKKRNRLGGARAEKLIFLKKNLPMFLNIEKELQELQEKQDSQESLSESDTGDSHSLMIDAESDSESELQ